MDELEIQPPNCAVCGAALRPQTRFCIHCGAPVGASDRAAAPVRAFDRWTELRSALRLWIMLLACSGGIGLITRLMDSESPRYDLAGTIAFAAIVIVYAAAMPREIGSLLVGRIGASAIGWAVAACLALLLFMGVYSAGLTALGVEWLSYLEPFDAEGWPLWSAFVLVAVCPAVFEEIAFRGIIYQRLERVGGPKEAVILQAAMFSILHLLPTIFISHFLIGLVLGWLRQRTKTLLPGMLTHGLYNAALLLFELLDLYP